MKQINVRVDERDYATIEARAAAAGLSVSEYAKRRLAEEASEERQRFLAAAAAAAADFTEAFEEAFGPFPAKRDVA